MAIASRLKAFLTQENIDYETLDHVTAYTAQEVAAAIHTPGREIAKIVMLRSEAGLLMAVVPAPARIDLEAFQKETGIENVRLAEEEDFRDRFPDCEVGAMPPFGNLYDVPVYVDEALREDETIAFNAGTHHEAIRLSYTDFERCVHPVVLSESVH